MSQSWRRKEHLGRGSSWREAVGQRRTCNPFALSVRKREIHRHRSRLAGARSGGRGPGLLGGYRFPFEAMKIVWS